MAMNTTAAPQDGTTTTQTVVVTQPAVVGGTGDPQMDQYYQESATRCFLNQSCNCCTCRCCAFTIAICWVIFGAYGAYDASVGLSWIGEAEACPAGSQYTGECCCISISDSACTTASYIEEDVCSGLRTAYTLNMIDNILQCIAGTCGVIGLAMFISWLLLIPMGYSAVSVILGIVAVILLLGEFGAAVAVSGVFGIGISVCLAILFWTNYKLIKDILGK